MGWSQELKTSANKNTPPLCVPPVPLMEVELVYSTPARLTVATFMILYKQGEIRRVHLLGKAAGPLATPKFLDGEAQGEGCKRAAAFKVELVKEVLHGQCCKAQAGSSGSAMNPA